jgi:hypothetical protein
MQQVLFLDFYLKELFQVVFTILLKISFILFLKVIFNLKYKITQIKKKPINQKQIPI